MNQRIFLHGLIYSCRQWAETRGGSDFSYEIKSRMMESDSKKTAGACGGVGELIHLGRWRAVPIRGSERSGQRSGITAYVARAMPGRAKTARPQAVMNITAWMDAVHSAPLAAHARQLNSSRRETPAPGNVNIQSATLAEPVLKSGLDAVRKKGRGTVKSRSRTGSLRASPGAKNSPRRAAKKTACQMPAINNFLPQTAVTRAQAEPAGKKGRPVFARRGMGGSFSRCSQTDKN